MEFDFNRGVNEELFYYWLGEVYENGYFENDTFELKQYDYSNEDEEYHFFHKPSGFKIQWYKYPFRSAICNMNISYDQFREILVDCKNSLYISVRYSLYPNGYWWER